MKRYRKLLSVCMAIMIFFMNLSINTLNVSASFDGAADRFEYSEISGFSMEDDSSIPSGNHFFYSYTAGKAWYCDLEDAIALVMNKSYGISMSQSTFTSLVSGFMAYASAYTGGAPINNRVVKKQGAVVGYALNSINTCKLVSPEQQDSYKIESDINNFIYVYVKQFIDSRPLDYITFQQLTGVEVSSKYSNWQAKQKLAALDRFMYAKWATNNNNEPDWCDTQGSSCVVLPSGIYYANDVSNFDSLVQYAGLSNANRTYSLRRSYNVGLSYFRVNCIDGEGNEIIGNNFDTDVYTIDGNNISMTGTSKGYFNLFGAAGSTHLCICNWGGTVYRSADITVRVQNNTYAPTINTSEQTNNYNSSSSNNTVNTNVSETNNATTTNNNIYNQQSENYTDNSYYNEENNYTIDNSVVTENNTTIINNYYGSGSGGDDSGGGSDDNDSGIDDTIWKTLLKAIADFFKKLGELIATVLTGIVEILTSILTAIASITSNFSAITDFFSAIFGWLPTEIITLMTLGLSMALFAAFITWFKK